MLVLCSLHSWPGLRLRNGKVCTDVNSAVTLFLHRLFARQCCRLVGHPANLQNIVIALA